MKYGKINFNNGINKIMDNAWLNAMGTLLDKSHIVIITDIYLDIQYVNSVFLDSTNLNEKDVLHKNFFDLMSEFNSPETLDLWLKELSENKISEIEIKMNFHKKIHWVEFIAKALIEPEYQQVIGFVFAGKFTDEIKKLKNQQINKNEKEILEDLKVAKDYFIRLLPNSENFKRISFGNGVLIYQPLRFIGGDWYFFTLKNRKLFLLVGDFIGHGIQAGILSSSMMTLLKEYNKWEKFQNPIEVLDYFIQKFIFTFQINDSLNIHLSIASIIYDYNSQTAEYVSFNYPIYHFKNELNRLDAYKVDINFCNWNKNHWKYNHIHFDSQEWIWIFSDGVKDQYGDASDKPLGIKKLKEILKDASVLKDVKETEKYLALKREEWMGTSTQTDDITLIGIKF